MVELSNYLKSQLVDDIIPSAFSNKKVEWECEKGHRWFAIVANRTKGNGCPVCSGYKDAHLSNPLSKELFEQLVDKSLKLSAKSSKKVQWQCKYGHTWFAKVYSRSNGAGCPICSGHNDAHITNPLSPDLVEELVDNTKMYSSSSRAVVDWRCKGGHVWSAPIYSRTSGSGCPTCARKHVSSLRISQAALLNPLPDDLASQLVVPQALSAGSGQRVEWKCPQGHQWFATPSNRAKGQGCPECIQWGTSKGEQEVAEYVKDLGFDIIQNDRQQIKPLELDIFIPALRAGIEYNGSYWHTDDAKEERKRQACLDKDVSLLTIWDYEWEQPGAKKFVSEWLNSCLNSKDLITLEHGK